MGCLKYEFGIEFRKLCIALDPQYLLLQIQTVAKQCWIVYPTAEELVVSRPLNYSQKKSLQSNPSQILVASSSSWHPTQRQTGGFGVRGWIWLEKICGISKMCLYVEKILPSRIFSSHNLWRVFSGRRVKLWNGLSSITVGTHILLTVPSDFTMERCWLLIETMFKVQGPWWWWWANCDDWCAWDGEGGKGRSGLSVSGDSTWEVEWDSKVANNTISNGIVPLEKELIVVLLYFQCDFMSASKQQNIQQALQIAQNLTSNP